jgi:hypothetical protein
MHDTFQTDCARSFARVLLLLGLACLVACSHDLDALQSGGAGADGGGGADASVALRDGGNDAATPEGDAGETLACAPCEDPEPLAGGAITPEACCTGQNRRECGARVGQGQCVARDIPGVESRDCPELTRAGVTFSGCCRADAQCGVNVGAFGCIARGDLPALLGGPLASRPCSVPCDGDAACQDLSGDLVCVEDDSHTAASRTCARGCTRDKECESLPGTVCAIQNNLTDNRVDSFCRAPFGPGELNDACSVADDCARGTCVADSRVSPPRRFCTQLCAIDLDCTGADDSCIETTIALPDMSGTQSFEICWNRTP